MTRLERNRQQASLIIARIERNMAIEKLCRAGQLIRGGILTKRQLQALIAGFQPKKEPYNG